MLDRTRRCREVSGPERVGGWVFAVWTEYFCVNDADHLPEGWKLDFPARHGHRHSGSRNRGKVPHGQLLAGVQGPDR